MLLCLVRHGETEWNTQNRLNGRTDTSLNLTGEQQAHLVGAYLKNQSWTKIYASPLQRAKRTAELINDHLVVSSIELDERLLERDYREYEGHVVNEVDWDVALKEVESSQDIIFRLLSFLDDLESKATYDDAVVVVTHGSVIRHFIALFNPFAESIPNYANASLTFVRFNPKGSEWVIEKANEITHLAV